MLIEPAMCASPKDSSDSTSTNSMSPRHKRVLDLLAVVGLHSLSSHRGDVSGRLTPHPIPFIENRQSCASARRRSHAVRRRETVLIRSAWRPNNEQLTEARRHGLGKWPGRIDQSRAACAAAKLPARNDCLSGKSDPRKREVSLSKRRGGDPCYASHVSCKIWSAML